MAKIASDKKMPESTSTIRGIFKKRDKIKSQGKDIHFELLLGSVVALKILIDGSDTLFEKYKYQPLDVKPTICFYSY